MSGASQKKKKEKFSYADYLQLTDDKRCELIDGEVYDMGPAPGTIHQSISIELATILHTFFRDKPCKVFAAPFDVRLHRRSKKDKDITRVVQPDISVICDEKKIDERGCLGAPDLIIEIISPASASHDHIVKRKLYEENGVREYWLVDPTNCIITAYSLIKPGKFAESEIYASDAQLTSTAFSDLTIDFTKVFPTG